MKTLTDVCKNSAMQGLSIFLLKASDKTDVVICLSPFTEIGTENIGVDYGMPKNLRLLSK